MRGNIFKPLPWILALLAIWIVFPCSAATELWPVTTANGTPLTNAEVDVTPLSANGANFTGDLLYYQTDTNGLATMTNLDIGIYKAAVNGPWTITSVTFQVTNFDSTNYISVNSVIRQSPTGTSTAYTTLASDGRYPQLPFLTGVTNNGWGLMSTNNGLGYFWGPLPSGGGVGGIGTNVQSLFGGYLLGSNALFDLAVPTNTLLTIGADHAVTNAGLVQNSQLQNSAVTITAGTGMSGGGPVALGGSTTFNNAGVTSLTSGGHVTASASAGGVTLGSDGTAANTVSTLVARDGSGNFAAQTVSVFSGNAFTLNITNGPITFYNPFPGGATTNVIILQDNQAIYMTGTNGDGKGATMSWQGEHSGGGEWRVVSAGRASVVMGPQGGFQIGGAQSGPQEDMYEETDGQATSSIPTTHSYPFQQKISTWLNGVLTGDFTGQYAVALNTNNSLPGSMATRFFGMQGTSANDYTITGNLSADLIPAVGAQIYGALMFSRKVSSVASNGVYWADCFARKQDVRLNGPATIGLTNYYLLAQTNSDTIEVALYSGLIGNCALSFSAAPGNLIWQDPFVQPTNVPANARLVITMTPEVLNGVTNVWCKSELYPYTTAIDADAATFLTAAGAVLPQESNQVNYLVGDLKAANLWNTAFDALYPMAGSTSAQMAWNLINTAKFKITWTAGSSTFTHSGWTSDGSASFGDTGFNASTATTPNYAQNSFSELVYSGTGSPALSGTVWLMGVNQTGIRAGIELQNTSKVFMYGGNDADNAGASLTYSSFLGPIVFTRTASTTKTLYASNGQSISSATASTGVPNANVQIGAVNSGGAFGFSALQFETVGIGRGLSSNEVATVGAILTRFNGGLGR